MSLINQMLRDLERRSRQIGQENQKLAAGPSTPQPRGSWYLAAGSICVLVLVVLMMNLQGGWPLFDQRQPEPVVALQSQKEVIAQEAVPPPPAKPLPSKSSVVPVAIPSLLAFHVQDTPGTARVSLEFSQKPTYRVEKTKDGSALEILLANTALSNSFSPPDLDGPLLKKFTLSRVAEGLTISISANEEIKHQLLLLPADTFHGFRLLVDLQTSRKVPPAPEPSAPISVTPTLAPLEISGAEVKPVAKVNKTIKPFSSVQMAERDYQKGLESLQREDLSAAEQAFHLVLEKDPSHSAARQQLLAILKHSGRYDEALGMYRDALQLNPADRAYRMGLAGLLHEQGDLQGALASLNQPPLPGIGQDTEFHAFRAALQQQTGDYEAAGKTYRQLLEVRPDSLIWWLGLGVSLDQSGDRLDAAAAYRQAISAQGLSPQLQDYVRDRLEVLKGRGGVHQ